MASYPLSLPLSSLSLPPLPHSFPSHRRLHSFLALFCFALLAFCLGLMKRPEEQVFVTHIYCLYKLVCLPRPCLAASHILPPTPPLAVQLTDNGNNFCSQIFYCYCHKRLQVASCTYETPTLQHALDSWLLPPLSPLLPLLPLSDCHRFRSYICRRQDTKRYQNSIIATD